MYDAGTIPLSSASVADLVEVYRALDACKLLLMGAVERADLESKDQGKELEGWERKRLLVDEEGIIEDRLNNLIKAITAAPIRSRMDAIQKMRFTLMEYGSSRSCAEPEIQKFIRDWEPQYA